MEQKREIKCEVRIHAVRFDWVVELVLTILMDPSTNALASKQTPRSAATHPPTSLRRPPHLPQ